MKLAIFGDMGGWTDELFSELVRLGMDPDTNVLPSNLRVCQVGDLVHRGPDSLGVVRLVNDVMAANPGQWDQLVGNHEQVYVAERVFNPGEVLDDEAVDILRDWWRSGAMQMAAAYQVSSFGPGVSPRSGQLLVTHAGLVAELWKKIGSPGTAREAADLLNERSANPVDIVWDPGSMLRGRPMPLVGPVWASAADELYPSWRRAGRSNPGFHQAHGHTTAYWWSKKQWLDGALGAGAMKGTSRAEVDPVKRRTRVGIWGQNFFGVDPSMGRVHPPRGWRPLVVTLAEE